VGSGTRQSEEGQRLRESLGEVERDERGPQSCARCW
jgi:hypothetical protein